MKINDILTNFNKDWGNSVEVRTDAANDLFFSRVSQWDDWLQDYSTLQYRGQFDVIRKEVRRVISEMRKNPIEVKFKPLDDADPNAADVLMGMYRNDMRNNTSRDAVNIAVREQIECGYGAWRIVTEYEDDTEYNANQVIRRIPIHEANTHVVWDSNARRIDKSDARHCTVITGFSTEGWKIFAKENGIDEDIPTFQNPDQNWQFQWIRKDVVYVGEYYEIEHKKDTVLFYADEFGDERKIYKSDGKQAAENLEAEGFTLVTQKKIKRCLCYKYLISGAEIIKDKQLIAGGKIPVVPVYGEWAFAGDKECYEGLVRLAKDPQRLRNMIMSYSADIVAKTPKKKPIFYQEQIQGYEFLWDGMDDYAYYILNRKTPNGEDLPPAPLAYYEPAEIPQAHQAMIAMSTEAVKEVTTEGLGAKEIAGQQIAFDTVNQLNLRTDMEWFIFLDNLATAMRRDGEIYASMAAEIYDVERKVRTLGLDGNESEETVMTQEVDFEKGEVKTVNNLNQKFDVYTDIGPSYQSMKDQYRSELSDLYKSLPPDSPVAQIILLQILTLMDGSSGELLRKYANKQLLLQGIREAETDEDEMILQEQAQSQQPDPAMVVAEAQNKLAEAEMIKSQTEAQSVMIKAFTAESEAQLRQAQTVKALAETENISEQQILKAIEVLTRASGQLAKQSTARTGEIPQSGEM